MNETVSSNFLIEPPKRVFPTDSHYFLLDPINPLKGLIRMHWVHKRLHAKRSTRSLMLTCTCYRVGSPGSSHPRSGVVGPHYAHCRGYAQNLILVRFFKFFGFLFFLCFGCLWSFLRSRGCQKSSGRSVRTSSDKFSSKSDHRRPKNEQKTDRINEY